MKIMIISKKILFSSLIAVIAVLGIVGAKPLFTHGQSSNGILPTPPAINISPKPWILQGVPFITYGPGDGSLPSSTLGKQYNAKITVSGGKGPFTCWAPAGGVPSPLTVHSDCTITGAFPVDPKWIGVWTVTVHVVDSTGFDYNGGFEWVLNVYSSYDATQNLIPNQFDNQPLFLTSLANNSLQVVVRPLTYANGKWNYQIYWNRTSQKTGSLYVTLRSNKAQQILSANPADGDNILPMSLLPSTDYRVEFYTQPNKGGQLVLRRFFTTQAVPGAGTQPPTSIVIDGHRYATVPGIWISGTFQNLGRDNFVDTLDTSPDDPNPASTSPAVISSVPRAPAIPPLMKNTCSFDMNPNANGSPHAANLCVAGAIASTPESWTTNTNDGTWKTWAWNCTDPQTNNISFCEEPSAVYEAQKEIAISPSSLVIPVTNFDGSTGNAPASPQAFLDNLSNTISTALARSNGVIPLGDSNLLWADRSKALALNPTIYTDPTTLNYSATSQFNQGVGCAANLISLPYIALPPIKVTKTLQFWPTPNAPQLSWYLYQLKPDFMLVAANYNTNLKYQNTALGMNFNGIGYGFGGLGTSNVIGGNSLSFNTSPLVAGRSYKLEVYSEPNKQGTLLARKYINTNDDPDCYTDAGGPPGLGSGPSVRPTAIGDYTATSIRAVPAGTTSGGVAPALSLTSVTPASGPAGTQVTINGTGFFPLLGSGVGPHGEALPPIGNAALAYSNLIEWQNGYAYYAVNTIRDGLGHQDATVNGAGYWSAGNIFIESIGGSWGTKIGMKVPLLPPGTYTITVSSPMVVGDQDPRLGVVGGIHTSSTPDVVAGGVACSSLSGSSPTSIPPGATASAFQQLIINDICGIQEGYRPLKTLFQTATTTFTITAQ